MQHLMSGLGPGLDHLSCFALTDVGSSAASSCTDVDVDYQSCVEDGFTLSCDDNGEEYGAAPPLSRGNSVQGSLRQTYTQGYVPNSNADQPRKLAKSTAPDPVRANGSAALADRQASKTKRAATPVTAIPSPQQEVPVWRSRVVSALHRPESHQQHQASPLKSRDSEEILRLSQHKKAKQAFKSTPSQSRSPWEPTPAHTYIQLPTDTFPEDVDGQFDAGSVDSGFLSSEASDWGLDGLSLERDIKATADLELLQLIGRGASASVWRAMWKGRVAAVKVVEHDEELLDTPEDGTSLAALFEAAVSSTISHPNVVATYDYSLGTSKADSDDYCLPQTTRETRIVMEYCDRGSLEGALVEGVFLQPDGGVDMAAVCATLCDVADALAYLHKMHVIHRDLKPKNILLKSSEADVRGFTAKVSDFGLSSFAPEAQMSSSTGDFGGTATHMAPELLSDGLVSTAADVYAFGILMWELYTGSAPYRTMSKLQIMVGVVTDHVRPSFPPGTPAWYTALASSCWHRVAASRPTFTTICACLRAHSELYSSAPAAFHTSPGNSKPVQHSPLVRSKSGKLVTEHSLVMAGEQGPEAGGLFRSKSGRFAELGQRWDYAPLVRSKSGGWQSEAF